MGGRGGFKIKFFENQHRRFNELVCENDVQNKFTIYTIYTLQPFDLTLQLGRGYCHSNSVPANCSLLIKFLFEDTSSPKLWWFKFKTKHFYNFHELQAIYPIVRTITDTEMYIAPCQISMIRSNCLQMFFNIGGLQTWKPATALKRYSNTGVFLWNVFTEH